MGVPGPRGEELPRCPAVEPLLPKDRSLGSRVEGPGAAAEKTGASRIPGDLRPRAGLPGDEDTTHRSIDLMGPLLYRQCVVDGNMVMWSMIVVRNT